ncbi:MAG TPA: nitrilase-related carbon-nitrogen hydrolase [Candidatus Cloacimonas acidaminovorans]|nr:nitrilase-related carbon-nitrogen hydrolase [Candidatus Cloacimonas acidaminovorans]HRS60230.1 nitrilase-related carbon-nitrogen hydrolase [Candidatus Cloacimonas sp.]HOM79671.1 nitrilase-related carbon-nitrogen hydrolase [Candidatus Cloacimonas acidaminovorans]HOT38610.1 nitrilase-related carbon-nitrogen hydrolase [Candidatus Cloacimonas acidaminovorans]HPC50287.1 nitrilase-related carbon-nitrogen hydrolase [Candidatus Cloacimonas acidaminovorans]
MKISALQFAPRLLDKEYNLKKMKQLLSVLKTDLVVLPELCNSGYVFANKEEVFSVAEEAGKGETYFALSEIASCNNCNIVYGYPELDGNNLYNSCMLIMPDGRFYNYRKTHLFNREKLFFSPGDTGFQVFTILNGVKIGMMICFDWQFPEAARTLALLGAQIICHPANLVLPWCQQAMKTRCLENRVFAVTANRIGTEINAGETVSFTGQSQILNTRGEVLSSLSVSEERTITVEINPEEANDKTVTERNDAFKDRRPEFYKL